MPFARLSSFVINTNVYKYQKAYSCVDSVKLKDNVDSDTDSEKHCHCISASNQKKAECDTCSNYCPVG